MTLHEFVDWFENNLAYKAPELWPDHISWFLDQLKERYEDAAEDNQ